MWTNGDLLEIFIENHNKDQFSNILAQVHRFNYIILHSHRTGNTGLTTVNYILITLRPMTYKTRTIVKDLLFGPVLGAKLLNN